MTSKKSTKDDDFKLSPESEKLLKKYMKGGAKVVGIDEELSPKRRTTR